MMCGKPFAVDLFCGLGGWTEALLDEGWFVAGFDIERHIYGEHQYPREAHLVLQDVTTLCGAQFKDAELIVCSPPCQAYSYRAMPWKRAKALPPPSNGLFDACFRIQREAIEATAVDCPSCAGTGLTIGSIENSCGCEKCHGKGYLTRHIPMIVENVRGAQKWVGRAAWNFGSYYLWGDVPVLMPNVSARKVPGFRFDGSGKSFQSASVDGVKVHLSGRAWYAEGLGKVSSKSPARKAASAMIAKIPYALASHIARCFYPRIQE
jgi:hypothetical protein